MDRKYNMSPELKQFLQDKENQKLLESSLWKELLYKASKTKGLLVSELIYCLVGCEQDNQMDKKMTVEFSDVLNKIIQNNEILEEALNKIKK